LPSRDQGTARAFRRGTALTPPRAEIPAIRRTIAVRRLGIVDYAGALELQQQLVEERRSERIGDTLILLEHPPVLTVGVRNRQSRANILSSPAELAEQGIAVFEAGRGGDVTYHGPGQLVGYPILDLRPDRCDVHRYVRDLETVLIAAIAKLGVKGVSVPGLSGVWVGSSDREEKVAAIGVRISRWITSHGFALNVSPNLEHFSTIVPCGIQDRGVTSLERVLGRQVEMRSVEDAVVEAFEAVFE
jgi:lipoyl(octanoyl) transferase